MQLRYFLAGLRSLIAEKISCPNGSNYTWLMMTAGVWGLLIPTKYIGVFLTPGPSANGELRFLKFVVLEGVLTHHLHFD